MISKKLINSKFINIHKSVLLNYLLVFSLLCYSGNLFVVGISPIMKPLFIIGFFILMCLWIFKGAKNIVDIVLYLIGFCAVLVLQNFFSIYWAVNTVSFMFIKLFIGIFIFSIVGLQFRVIYFNVVFFLSFTSLIFFSLNYIGVNFTPFSVFGDRNTIFLYTQLVDRESGEIVLRNSGMFWEPGAFQGYINLLFLFYLPSLQLLWQNRKIEILTIITALITTFSTTGYLVFAVILLSNLLFFQRSNASRSLIYFLIASITLYLIFINVPFLADKLGLGNVTGDETELGGDRIMNLKESIPLITKSPLLGYGFSQDSLSMVENGFSNGWAAYIFFMGLFGFLVYYIFLVYRLKKQRLRSTWIILFLIVHSLLMQGEGFLTHPFFLALPFLNIATVFKKQIFPEKIERGVIK